MDGSTRLAQDAAADLAGQGIAGVYNASDGTCAALRVTAKLRYGLDIVVGHNAVEPIMREFDLDLMDAYATVLRDRALIRLRP